MTSSCTHWMQYPASEYGFQIREELLSHVRGVGRGGSEGSDDPPFLGANFIHFLYEVLVQRSVQKQPF